MADATPRPWNVTGGRFIWAGETFVADLSGDLFPNESPSREESEANTNLIVTAVNSHAALTARVAELEAALRGIVETCAHCVYGNEHPVPIDRGVHEAARAALGKDGSDGE